LIDTNPLIDRSGVLVCGAKPSSS